MDLVQCRCRRGIVGLALVVATGVAVVSEPHVPAVAVGRLPSCDVGDVYTVPRDYDDWSVTLVDRLLRVGKAYVPPDLVHVSEAGLPGGGHLRAVAVDDTRAMARAARAAGAAIGVWSAYRSYAEQEQIFTGYSRQNGYASAITYSQRPGHSEHQLGLGVDFMSAGGGNPLPGDWGTTAAGRWMRENSWRFGWVNSYPRGTDGARWNDRTCLRYEPWHYRYLGREVAAKVHRSGLTIREYLWRHHTQLDSNGNPLPAPPPTPSISSARPTSRVPAPTTTEATVTPVPASTSSAAPIAVAPQQVDDVRGVPAALVRGLVGVGIVAVVLVALVLRGRRGSGA
ncbi:M15 family metallopeptidase [Intrasporangium calvum]|uniref:M15 family metallopeptidase n=1 Tax=Intrasporangium calvum TaxID=53358 RepID=A0ABT5GIH7_9MICO|nr:M15 family metallopeptidase [Intrasporangium calvum]MDC5697908.1 M15 family metallopeptidase [Intrasporangium calvum]